jgi:hypothetical protein
MVDPNVPFSHRQSRYVTEPSVLTVPVGHGVRALLWHWWFGGHMRQASAER